MNSSSPSLRDIEFAMPFPWIFCNPFSITLHLEESIIMGTLEISGSEATSLRNFSITSSELIKPSSIFTSII